MGTPHGSVAGFCRHHLFVPSVLFCADHLFVSFVLFCADHLFVSIVLFCGWRWIRSIEIDVLCLCATEDIYLYDQFTTLVGGQQMCWTWPYSPVSLLQSVVSHEKLFKFLICKGVICKVRKKGVSDLIHWKKSKSFGMSTRQRWDANLFWRCLVSTFFLLFCADFFFSFPPPPRMNQNSKFMSNGDIWAVIINPYYLTDYSLIFFGNFIHLSKSTISFHLFISCHIYLIYACVYDLNFKLILIVRIKVSIVI